ncbi:MAG TPA: Mpo1-like protein [Nevskiaceae bacterium]|nr:Mpo1-like protein [Nevskiaceae bacterium]
MPDEDRSFGSFRDFYPFYLGEHANRTCRRLHFVGTSLVILTLIGALASGQYWYLLLMPVFGYAFAWIGHFHYEKNRPATFEHPFYSLAGDFVMYRDIWAGKIRF